IYYTLDGSNPTYDSTMYQAAGIREGGETLTISETTTIKWFSVDASGNIEGKYSPGRNNAPSATITIEN
ncbi:chitobiase/beta-hexosaminidase C-terminal domain-containing protein, partial [Ilumatobacter sp.]|uniref:chitobiase/beta-hexosaminidase C-terminal domain-containing protein n=1 Tax=Ilumatobacter sp. TaxID=1967498 RepID=UPI003C554C3B